MQSPVIVHVCILHGWASSACDTVPQRRWYEIDQAEVLRVKQKALQANEAPMKFADNEGARIPVRASQVHQISADLAEAGWPNALQDAGLDGRQLVHWHAEGLLMYLAEQDVRNLLIEASRVGHAAL